MNVSSPDRLLGELRRVRERVSKLEAELAAATRCRHDQLAHESRLCTMGEMAAEIAHELNQPLCSILNFAKASRNVLACRDAASLEDVDEWLRCIEGAATRAARMLERVRSFTRVSDDQLTVGDLEQVIRETLELLRPELRRHQITLQLDTRPALAVIDKLQISQVVVNLFQNAIEASKASDSSRTVEVTCQHDGEMVSVMVSDRGHGLPKDPSKIFQPFVTTKPSGLGMGLAISQRIIEIHGGRLTAAPNPGGGACIGFSLPLSHDEASA